MFDQKSLRKHGGMIISTTAQLLPHLKIAVPTAVTVWWLFKQTLGKKRKAKSTVEPEVSKRQ